MRAAVQSPSAMPMVRPFAQPERVDAIHNDFIPHPTQFPLHFRRSLLPWRARRAGTLAGDVGLSFYCARYLAAGTRIEVEIPLRGVTQRFTGTVVMVRETTDGYEIGVWLASPDDAVRARIVEKICHTECNLRARAAASA